ncbi:uncharacterized protein K460DRAFT_123852 [Cucurbitaria berberidis CBS 394.84]|uniref:Uncharacterized protein n=1 Tax=Cucurbitaria berberidis CBS 394.84 TaxID=1168544 RepID=A0A9P4GJE4_9PLEO|nr:uncharacterized protein K460DRAFT_123852 [Cucurbitaria berberidis CBS 394.84]KAF1846372.1 hypothetical protein K460DRAFT_123852 [Cucurbitaria berberidis CBS 394.84]
MHGAQPRTSTSTMAERRSGHMHHAADMGNNTRRRQGACSFVGLPLMVQLCLQQRATKAVRGDSVVKKVAGRATHAPCGQGRLHTAEGLNASCTHAYTLLCCCPFSTVCSRACCDTNCLICGGIALHCSSVLYLVPIAAQRHSGHRGRRVQGNRKHTVQLAHTLYKLYTRLRRYSYAFSFPSSLRTATARRHPCEQFPPKTPHDCPPLKQLR